MVVQGLSVDGSNGSKRKVAIVALGYVIHFSYYLVFVHVRTKYLHGRNMHIGCHVAGFFYFGNFFGRLIITL